MFLLNQKVCKKGQKSPVGIIDQINEDNTVIVLWGIADKARYTERFHISELQHSTD